jgi:hypothetical protein
MQEDAKDQSSNIPMPSALSEGESHEGVKLTTLVAKGSSFREDKQPDVE